MTNGSFSPLFWKGFSNRFESWVLMLVWDMQGSQVQGGGKKSRYHTLLHLQQGLSFAIYSKNYLVPSWIHFYLKQHYIVNVPSWGLRYSKLPDLSLKDEPTCSDSREIKRKHRILPPWKRGLELALWCLSATQARWAAGGGSHVSGVTVSLGNCLTGYQFSCLWENGAVTTDTKDLHRHPSHHSQRSPTKCSGAWREEACREVRTQ